jgi:mono/diheme cytochrome c family protein
MNRKVQFLLLTLAATSFALAWGSVTTHAVVGLDERAVERGKALFHRKAACFVCHGLNGDIKQVTRPDVAQLNPRPADLRERSDKSVRQMYLIIKYGIHETGMVAIQPLTRLRDDEMLPLLSYVLALQRTPLSQDEMLDQSRRRDGDADRAIMAMCAEQAIGDSDAAQACEDQYMKRYRDLVMGRPADISRARYAEIQASCKQRFGTDLTDLDGLARCYGLEYGMARQRTP